MAVPKNIKDWALAFRKEHITSFPPAANMDNQGIKKLFDNQVEQIKNIMVKGFFVELNKIFRGQSSTPFKFSKPIIELISKTYDALKAYFVPNISEETI